MAETGKEIVRSVGELFTPQEEAFLRHYSESKLRYEAMIAAGFVTQPPTVQEEHAVMSQASALVARAEQLSLSQLGLALGADRIYFLSRLKWVCDSDQGHIAIKGLNLLARIHGLFEKEQRATQVALIFNQAQTPASSEKPVDLPFNLSSKDYRPFTPVDTENEGTT